MDMAFEEEMGNAQPSLDEDLLCGLLGCFVV